MVTSAWSTWTQIPRETRTLMWERFQSYYCWDSALDRMLQIWETKSSKNYNDGMNATRTKAGKLAVNDGRPYRDDDPHRDMNLLKDFPPRWLTKSIWEALIDKWNNGHWKTVSKKFSNNRMTKIDGEISKHTNGSISTSRHVERLRKARNGVPPTWVEVFDYTHRKRSKSTSSSSDSASLGDYVTRRDGRMAGTYKGDVNQKYGEDATSHPIIDEALWKQASESSGGSKKGRIYCFGNTSDLNLVLTGVPSGGYASGASPSDTRIQALEARRQQSEEAREKDLKEMRRQEEVRMKEITKMRQIDEVRMKEMEEMRQIEEVRKKEYQDMMDLVKRLSQSQFTYQRGVSSVVRAWG